MSKKSVLISLLLLLALFLIACEEQLAPQPIPPPTFEEEVVPSEEPEEAPLIVRSEPTEEKVVACSTTSDCSAGDQCIDGSCGTVAELYRTDCAQTCSVRQVDITTSDGATYQFPPGKGSYTAAGGLEWKVESIPAHCPEEKELVPFRISKYTYGKLVSDEVITVREGTTSKVLTHPTITTLKFTLKVTGVECS